MIKNSLIIVLALLLAASSYLLYDNIHISIVLDNSEPSHPAGTSKFEEFYEKEILGTLSSETSGDTDIKDDPESLDADEIKPYLDPTVRLTINADREIVTDYRVIGPRKFALLTGDDEPMVEINLDTGQVKINSDYTLDEVSTEFWESIGRKYPEVCFVE
jgi:hypothetical protein